MPVPRPRSRSPIWARSTSASRGQEVPAPGRRRSVSAPRRPTAGAAAQQRLPQRFAEDLGRPRPLPSRTRARSAPARARPDASGTLRGARRKHAQEQQHAALEARSTEQAAELCRLRRSLKALSAERDELRAFKEGAERSVKQRERRWAVERGALSARLVEMESSFAEQVKELRRDAMGGAALQKTAEQLSEQLAAAEAEAAAARRGHAERLATCEEHLQLALQAGQQHAAALAEARAAEQAWRARQHAEQAQREALQAELAAFSAEAAATKEEVRAMAERHGNQLHAAQARELELERSLQLALSSARGAARRAEVERRMLGAEVGALEVGTHALLSRGATAAHLVAVHEHSLELSREEAALRVGVVGALSDALGLEPKPAPGTGGLAAHAHCMDVKRLQLSHAMQAMADEGGGVERRRDALLVSQQHVSGAMRHALAAHRDEARRGAAPREGSERPLRAPEEVLWAEMVSNMSGLSAHLRSAVGCGKSH